jgi:hypothetical protein
MGRVAEQLAENKQMTTIKKHAESLILPERKAYHIAKGTVAFETAARPHELGLKPSVRKLAASIYRFLLHITRSLFISPTNGHNIF